MHPYEAGYRHSGIARGAAADGNSSLAKSHARDAITQLGRAEGFMDSWPADVQNWVKVWFFLDRLIRIIANLSLRINQTTKAEMEKLVA
jgi:hypothetical protein